MSGTGGTGSGPLGAGAGGVRGGSKSSAPRPVKIAAVSLIDLKEQAGKAPTPSRGWGVVPQPATSVEGSGVSSSLFPPVSALKQQFHPSQSGQANTTGGRASLSSLARTVRGVPTSKEKSEGKTKGDGEKEGTQTAGLGQRDVAGEESEQNEDAAAKGRGSSGAESGDSTTLEKPAEPQQSGGSVPNGPGAGGSSSGEKSGEGETETSQKGDSEKAKGDEARQDTPQSSGAARSGREEDGIAAPGAAISLSKLITASKKVGISVSVRGRAVNTAAGTVKSSGSAWKSGVSAAASSSGASASTPFFAGAASSAGPSSLYAARAAGAAPPTGPVDDEAFPDLMKSAEQVKLEAQKEKDRQKRTKEALRRAEKGDENGTSAQPQARRLGLQELFDLTEGGALSGLADKSGDKETGAARPIRVQRRWADEEPEEEEDFLQSGEGDKGPFYPEFGDGRRDPVFGKAHFSPLPHFVLPGMEGTVVAGYLSFMSLGQRVPPPAPPPMEPPAPPHAPVGPAGSHFRTNAFYNLPGAGAFGESGPQPSLLQEKNWRRQSPAPDGSAGSLLPTNAFQGGAPGRIHLLQRGAGNSEGQHRTLPPPGAVGQSPGQRMGPGVEGAPQRGPFVVTDADLERQRELARQKAEEKKREEEERERAQKERANKKLQELDERLARTRENQGVEQGGASPSGGGQKGPESDLAGSPALGRLVKGQGASLQGRGGARGPGTGPRGTSGVGDEREDEDWRRPSPPGVSPPSGPVSGRKSPRGAGAAGVESPFPPAVPRNPPPPPPLAAPARGRHEGVQKSLLGAGKNLHHHQGSGDPSGPLLGANPLIGGADLHAGHMKKGGMKGEPGENDGMFQAGLLGAKSHQPPPPPPATAALGGRGPTGKGLAGVGAALGERDGLRLHGRQGVQGPVGLDAGLGSRVVNGDEALPPLLAERGARGGAQFGVPLLQGRQGARDEDARPGFQGRKPAAGASERAGPDSELEGADFERRQAVGAARPRYRFGALVNQHLEERQKEEEEVRRGSHGADPAGGQGAASQREKSVRGERGSASQQSGGAVTADHSRSQSVRRRGEAGAGPDSGTWRQAPRQVNGVAGGQGATPSATEPALGPEGDGDAARQPGRDRGLQGDGPGQRGRGTKRDAPGVASQPLLPDGSPASGASSGPQKHLPRGMLPFPSPLRGGPQTNGSAGGGASPATEKVEGHGPFAARERGGRGAKQATSPSRENWRAEKAPVAAGGVSEDGARPASSGGRSGRDDDRAAGLVSGVRNPGQQYVHGSYARPANPQPEPAAFLQGAERGASQGGSQQPPLIANAPLLSFAPSAPGGLEAGRDLAAKGYAAGAAASAQGGVGSSASRGAGETKLGGSSQAVAPSGALPESAAAAGPHASSAQPLAASGGSGDLSFKALLSTRPAPTVLVATHHSTKSEDGPAPAFNAGGVAGSEGPGHSGAAEGALHSTAGDKTRGPGSAGVLGDTPYQGDDGDRAVRGPGRAFLEGDERGKDRARKGERGSAFLGGRGGSGSGGDSAGAVSQPAGRAGAGAQHAEAGAEGAAASGAGHAPAHRGQADRQAHAKPEDGERGGAARNLGTYRKAGGGADGPHRAWGVEKPGKALTSKERDEEENRASATEAERTGASGGRRNQPPFGEGEQEDSGAGVGRSAGTGPHSRTQRGGDSRQGEEPAHAGEGGNAMSGGRGGRGGAASSGGRDGTRRSAGGRGATEAVRSQGAGVSAETGRAPSPGGAAGDQNAGNAGYPKGRDQGLLASRGGKGGRGGMRGGAASGRGSVYGGGEKAETGAGLGASNTQTELPAPEDGSHRHRGQGGGPRGAASRQAAPGGAGTERGEREPGAPSGVVGSRGPATAAAASGRDRAGGTSGAVWLPKGAKKVRDDTGSAPGTTEGGAGAKRGEGSAQPAGGRGTLDARQGRVSPASGASSGAGGEGHGDAAPHSHPKASGRRDSRNSGGAAPPAMVEALLTRVNGALSVGAGLVCVRQEDHQEDTSAADDEGFQLVKSKRREQQEKRKKTEHKQRGSDRGAAVKAAPPSSNAGAVGAARSNARREKGQPGAVSSGVAGSGGDAQVSASGTKEAISVAGSTAPKGEGLGPGASPRDQGAAGVEGTEQEVASGGRGPRHEGGGRRPSASPRGGGRGGAQHQRGEGRKDVGKGGVRSEGGLTASSTMDIPTVSSDVAPALEDQYRSRQRGQEEAKADEGDTSEKKEAVSASGLLPLPGVGSRGGSRAPQRGKHAQESGDQAYGAGEGKGGGSGFSVGGPGGGSARDDGGHRVNEKGRERRGSTGKATDRRVGGHIEDPKRRQDSPVELEGQGPQGSHTAPSSLADPWYSASQGLDAANAMSQRLSSDPAQAALSDPQGAGLMIPAGHQGNSGNPGDRDRAGASPSAGPAPAAPAYSLWSSNFNQPVTSSSRVAPETIAAIWARDAGSAGATAVGGAARGARIPGGPGGAPDMAGLAHHPMTPVGMPLSPHQGAPGAPFHAGGQPGPLGPLHFQCPPIHPSLQAGARGASAAPGSDGSASLCASQPQLLGHGASSHRVPPSHLLHASQHLMHAPGAPNTTLFQPGCYGTPGGATLPPGAPRMPAQRNVSASLTGNPQSLSKNEILAPPLLPGAAAQGLVTLPPGQGSGSSGPSNTSPRLDLYDPRNPLSGPSFSPVPPAVSAPGAHPGVVAGGHSSSYVMSDGHHLLPGFAHPQAPAFSASLAHEAPASAPGAPGSGRAASGGQGLWVPGVPGAAQAGPAFVTPAPGPHQQGRSHNLGRGSDMFSPQGFGAIMPSQPGGRNGQRFGVMGGGGQPGAGAPGGGEFYM
ncbi:Collagen alpha-1(III) chain (Precursor), related [Neospora caninum Liverpool]|uniref:Collagen alpha-1(III) chain (Precursor), related n=1 Tax=Neospora caninum (strain Liverpool) TaxID=572307 RepID=F0VND7_NEOCL|nr:Collagen alpha-1(III) chain (Precursor), related [Neospora caninum Liverpool]CBZ55233.1 Collagen alpha-1(III) chain (Precursor), related [Neospora caninum Liverpool]CEL69961.1 TPA: Collagen alpha-1(III) chain (Precursor), related [Neospora caninum Liverpool]|eukprot:XP_003885261.1 Collagen alpha-1(III) chain (Precursor), related [Neospora caninum Liverpool]